MAPTRAALALATIVLIGGACVNAAPVSAVESAKLNNVDLAVFDQDSASSADTNKNYVIFAYDDTACAGGNSAKCAALQEALNGVISTTQADSDFQAKYGETVVFGKANKDAFPDHKQDFEKARVPLPAVLFWPAGHSRPSCKYDSDTPSPSALQDWLNAKLKEEEDDDDSLLQIDEGVVTPTDAAEASTATDESAPVKDALQPEQKPTDDAVVEEKAVEETKAVVEEKAVEETKDIVEEKAVEETKAVVEEKAVEETKAVVEEKADESKLVEQKQEVTETDAAAIEDESLLFCKVSEAPKEKEENSNLVQVDKTEQIYSYKEGKTIYTGPADNSLPKDITDTSGPVNEINAASFTGLIAQNKYILMYFKAEWCHYCGCLPPVFDKIAGNLITSKRQPNLLVATVDGDKSPALRDLFKVEVYPTILLVNRDATKVLGRYLGPRKNFEISNWVEDLIVADENPVVKYQFDAVNDKPEVHDMYPVFPYEGAKAFGEQGLISLSAQVSGNDMEECTSLDESKFTAPGAALLIHYPTDSKYEFDSSKVSMKVTPEKLTIIDFYTPWCPHCQKLHPVWDEVASSFEGKDVVVGKVNLENHPDIKKEFGIRKFPTIVFFEPGKPMEYSEDRRYVGKRTADALGGWVNGLMGNVPSANKAPTPEAPPAMLAAAPVAGLEPTNIGSSDAPMSLPTERQ